MKGITTQEGRETLNKFKMEAANEVGVNLKQGYNGDLTAREVGSVGGQMVKKMIDAYTQQVISPKNPKNSSAAFRCGGAFYAKSYFKFSKKQCLEMTIYKLFTFRKRYTKQPA